MSSRTRLSFPVTLDECGRKSTISIADPSSITAENLALATWGSSVVLSNTLHKLPRPDLTGTGLKTSTVSVLELGAGTGLVGLSAAAIWKTTAVLTDLPPIVPNLEANIDLNRDVVARHGGEAHCGVLDWSSPDADVLPKQIGTASSARVVLAADTVYSEEHPELLCRAIASRLERSREARFIMCYPLRIGNLDYIRDLWQRLESMALKSIQEGREELDQDWDEDVECEWSVWAWV